MFQREISEKLQSRLAEDRTFIQIVIGPRQTGKTTAVHQALEASNIPYRFAVADAPSNQSAQWIQLEWTQARRLASQGSPAILALDEVQKIDSWSSIVKMLWDEDSRTGLPLHVVLSGSSSLMLHKGMSDSVTGRFERLDSTHWTLDEMSEAFGYDLEDFLRFGGYPGTAVLKDDPDRWRSYMRDAIIQTTITRDVLEMTDVRKPALMKNLFELGAQHSGQEVSYRKLLGQLDDKGNTDTLAHYLDLLSLAGILSGLQKFNPKPLASRRSSPRLMIHDTSLMTSMWQSTNDLIDTPDLRGHLIESAVGAYLIARSKYEGFSVNWWRDGNHEVDFVISKGERITAIEVKSGKPRQVDGLAEFMRRNPKAQPLVVGDNNTDLKTFLTGGVQLF